MRIYWVVPEVIANFSYKYIYIYSVVIGKITPLTIHQFWPVFFDRCVQFVQLTTVDIRNNRLVSWKQLKKYHTLPIPPNRQHNLFLMQFSFQCCLWWFITLWPSSFSNDVTLNNTFLITSDNSFQIRIEFIAFKMQITSVDAFC